MTKPKQEKECKCCKFNEGCYEKEGVFCIAKHCFHCPLSKNLIDEDWGINQPQSPPQEECNGTTHYCCDEQLYKNGGKVECCGCTHHKCKDKLESTAKWNKDKDCSSKQDKNGIVQDEKMGWGKYDLYDIVEDVYLHGLYAHDRKVLPIYEGRIKSFIKNLLAEKDKEILSLKTEIDVLDEVIDKLKKKV